MEEERKKKKILPVVALVCVTLLVIALGSYAYWQITRKQEGKNVVGTACLNITFSDSNDIELKNAWPLSDSEGANTQPYSFTIKNECDAKVNYVVGLESLAADPNNDELSDYLDYSYIKVKLDNESPKIYGTLTGITNDSGVRETKELTHHTLEANASVTHYLRLWVDENTPAQNADETLNTSKYFYGRIKVTAGQNIEGDPEVNQDLKVLTTAGEPVARINNIKIGDRLGYKGEEFYVIKIDGNDVRLLSRYLINVGLKPNPDVPEGLQNVELGYTRRSIESSPEIMGSYYGAAEYSNQNYWCNESSGQWTSPYTANSFIYNNQATISTYVNEYVQTLETMGLKVVNGELLRIDDVSTLCGINIVNNGTYSSQCPDYIFETTYWLGSAGTAPAGIVWAAIAYGDLINNYYRNDGNIGVRPVINITLY